MKGLGNKQEIAPNTSTPTNMQNDDTLSTTANDTTLITAQKMDLTKETVSWGDLQNLFVKLYSIKKSGLLSFKKKVDPVEEDVLGLLATFLRSVNELDFCRFLLECRTEIDLFYALTFNPMNKNKKLTDMCVEVAFQMISLTIEIYVDCTQQRRGFSHSGGDTPSYSPRKNDPKAQELNTEIANQLSKAVTFLSLMFVSHTKYIGYKMNTEKSKIFRSLVIRLMEGDQKSNYKAQDHVVMLKTLVKASVSTNDERKLLTMTQAWFQTIGLIIDKSELNKVEASHDGWSFIIATHVKYKNKIFDFLDYYMIVLLASPDHQKGLMSIMQKHLANYIHQTLGTTNAGDLDIDLFKLIFDLINKLFQQRKSLLGTNAIDDDENDYFTSGLSSGEQMNVRATTLCKEPDQEVASFRELQKMTGKLYLQLIDRLMTMQSRTVLEEFKLFSIFDHNDNVVSYLEIFEPHFSLTLVKKILTRLTEFASNSLTDSETKERLVCLFKIRTCSDRQCNCFVSDLLKDIIFKLATKCPSSAIQMLLELLQVLIRTLMNHNDLAEKIGDCYFRCFSKTFMSLLMQTMQTIQDMTIQLPQLESSSLADSGPDYKAPSSPGAFRKINLFFDCIHIDKRQIRLSKELYESILLLIADVHGVKEFKAGQPISIDLDMEGYSNASTQDIIESIQNRWQVRLLSLRNGLVEMSAKILKQVYTLKTSNKIFSDFCEFFSDLNLKRGTLLHSFYMGFITKLFTNEFSLQNYKTPNFYKYCLIFDFYLKGLGYFDRDERLPLPIRVQKDYLEYLLFHLKLKLDPTDIRLSGLQILISTRLGEMIHRDPPILKCTIPLIFSVAEELMLHFDEMDTNSNELAECMHVIFNEKSLDNVNGLLQAAIQMLNLVMSITHIYSKFPVVLRPQVLANTSLITASGFNFQTFGDIGERITSADFLERLIKLTDKKATSAQPHTDLTKFLTYVIFQKSEVVPTIFAKLLEKCLEPSCLDETFKSRMKLFISFLTLENNMIVNSDILEDFIKKFEGLFINSIATVSNVKKQWFLTVLIKWVYLATQSDLPIMALRSMIDSLKKTNDLYIVENCVIFESYLAALKGLFAEGTKEIREMSLFDEWTLLPRKKLALMMKMVDKFYKGETFEEEARLMQYHFDLNLFEFFNPQKLNIPCSKIIEAMLLKMKPFEFRWTHVYDAKNVILYSITESDKDEICIIKRHITGKTCWFLQETVENMYAEKERLEIIDPLNARPYPIISAPTNNLLPKLIKAYREDPKIFDQEAENEKDVLLLQEESASTERVSSFESFPDHLRYYWTGETGGNSLQNDDARPIETAASHPRAEQSEETDSATGSKKAFSRSSSFAQERRESDLTNGTKSKCPSTCSNILAISDPKIRFIVQFGLFNQISAAQSAQTGPEVCLVLPFEADRARFKSSMNIIDKTKFINKFKVGILFIGPAQDKEEEILANPFPSTGLFTRFISNLGEKHGEFEFMKSLGNDIINYQVGPMIPRASGSTFEVKRVVGNVPTLIIWSQNSLNINYESIKSKFNRDIIVIEELPNSLLRLKSLRKIDEHKLEAVYKPDGIMTLAGLLNMIHGYIFSSQMEINPKIFSALENEYKTISPFLEARKKKIRDVVNAFTSKPLDFETLAELVSSSRVCCFAQV